MEDQGRFPGDDQEPSAHVRVLRSGFALEDLVAAGLPDYATRLWLPMLLSQRPRLIETSRRSTCWARCRHRDHDRAGGQCPHQAALRSPVRDALCR